MREARDRAGLTQTELAKLVGVKQPTVAAWEKGTNEPQPPTLRTLARVLRVAPDWLTGRSDDGEEPQVPPRIAGALAAHPQWSAVRAQLASIYSEEILDEVGTAQFATGPREYLDVEYARRIADAIAYARAQSLK